MNISTDIFYKLTVLTFAAALLLAGCDNPADNGHEEHSDPHSMEFVMNGETIVTYSNDGTISGHFHIEEQQETSLITAKFYTEDGDEIHDEDLGDEYSLGWEVGSTDLADIEQHEADGRWSFHVVGKAAGETTVVFQLMHGDHSDFSTDPIDIHVGQHSH